MILKLFAILVCTSLIYAGNFVDIHGFMSQGFFASNNYNFLAENSRDGSFELREVGINFQKPLGNRFRVGMQFLTRDVGVYGNNRITLDWAYGNVMVNEKLNISVGRTKLPLGIYSEVQDFDFITPYALMPSVIYEKGLRAIIPASDGIRLYGIIPMKRAGSFQYSFSYGDINTGDDDFNKYLDLLQYAETLDRDIRSIVCGNIFYETPLQGLGINVSYLRANEWMMEKGHNRSLDIYADLESDLNWFYAGVQYLGVWFDLIAEFHHRYSVQDVQLYKADGAGGFIQIPVSVLPQVPDTLNRGGWYAGFQVKPLNWFNVGGYFQRYYNRYDEWHYTLGRPIDTDDPSNINQDIALSTTFNIKQYLTIKLEGHSVYGTALLSPVINPDNDFEEDNWFYGVIKVTYNF